MSEVPQNMTNQQTLRIQRSFEVGPAQLYSCFTQAEHLGEWFGPKGVSCRNVEVDARVGGIYQLEMVNPDGSTIGLTGKFLQLEEPKLIQMTWRWLRQEETEPGAETLVTIHLSPQGTGTVLKLKHERFAEISERDNHESGWSSSLDCLEEQVNSSDPNPQVSQHR